MLMSEKRFKLNDKGSFILEDEEPLKPLGKVVDLLNEQQATIEQLQEELELTANTKLFSRRKLEEENEQLRQQLNDCEKFRHSVFKRMNELTDQLKEKEEDEKLYAEEILKLREINEFNELGGDY